MEQKRSPREKPCTPPHPTPIHGHPILDKDSKTEQKGTQLFQQVVLGKLDIQMEKNKTLIINTGSIRDLNTGPETINFQMKMEKNLVKSFE